MSTIMSSPYLHLSHHSRRKSENLRPYSHSSKYISCWCIQLKHLGTTSSQSQSQKFVTSILSFQSQQYESNTKLEVIQTASEIPDSIKPVGIHWDQNFTLLPICHTNGVYLEKPERFQNCVNKGVSKIHWSVYCFIPFEYKAVLKSKLNLICYSMAQLLNVISLKAICHYYLFHKTLRG